MDKVLLALLAFAFGFLGFLAQKLFEKLYVERLLEYNRIRSGIAKTYLIIVNERSRGKLPEAFRKEYSEKLYGLAAELAAFHLTGNLSWFLNRFAFTAKKAKANIFEAHMAMIELSAMVYYGQLDKISEVKEVIDRICDRLKLIAPDFKWAK